MSSNLMYENLIAFHPGSYVEDIVEVLNITQKEFAARLGTTETLLSKLVNGEDNLSNEMAYKLSKLTGISINTWMNIQNKYDQKVLEINETRCTRCESLAIEDGIREAKKMLAGLDMVNHPPHYNHGKFEAVEVIKDWKLNFNLGSVIKYIARADHKGNREQDLQKALWYLNREVNNE